MNEEIAELFDLLEEAGLKPQQVDENIPFYEDYVKAGIPTMPGDAHLSGFFMPQAMSLLNPIFNITVSGNSMVGAGIDSGDILTIRMDNRIYDGDIVLADIDGEMTVKTYFHDDNGEYWLLPHNSDFKPIFLNERMKVRIVGKVIEVTKKVRNISLHECQKILHKATDSQAEKPKLSRDQLRDIVRDIACQITMKRLWYSVFRPIADDESSLLKKNDYERFCYLVKEWMPAHQHLPTVAELQRMAVLSFLKPVGQWDVHNAPVKGRRFLIYKKVGEQVKDKIDALKAL